MGARRAVARRPRAHHRLFPAGPRRGRLLTLRDRVAAAIVNFNAGDHVVACVQSLRAAGIARIVVADNGSTDGSVEALRAADPDAVIVETGANLGYGGGVNRAAATIAGAEILLVSNPDVVVAPNAVEAMVAALDADATLGVVGPRIDNTEGTLYPSARTFPRLVDAVGHAFLGLIAPENRFTKRYRLLDWDHATARRVDWVSGACFAIRAELFRAIGGFDHRYFMYLEDVDLCRRVTDAGYAVGYEPSARVMHVQGVSAGQLPYRMLYAHHRSIMRWWWTSTGPVGRLAAPAIGAGLGLRLLLATGARLLGRGR